MVRGITSQNFVWYLASKPMLPFWSRTALAMQRLLNWYSNWTTSSWVEVTSVEKVKKKFLVTRCWMASRALGLVLLPPTVGSICRLEMPVSF